MPKLRTDVEDHVLTITIDRPEIMNCIDGQTAQALEMAWERFDQDDDLRVAILTGAGDEAFCSGADLTAIETLGPGPEASPEEIQAFVEDGTGYLGGTRFTHLDKPIIAAVNGYALAGGLELACFCDLRIAAENAELGVTCRRWNVPLVDGGTQRLPRIVGLGHAMDLILTGRVIDAHEAAEMGLVNEVVPEGGALTRAKKLARLLADHPQGAMRADKASVVKGLGRSLPVGLQIEARNGRQVIGSEAFREGVASFQARDRGGQGP